MDSIHEGVMTNGQWAKSQKDRETVAYYFDLLFGEADEHLKQVRMMHAGDVESLNRETDPEKRKILREDINRDSEYLQGTQVQRDALDMAAANVADLFPDIATQFEAVPNSAKYEFLLRRYRQERLEGVDVELSDALDALTGAQITYFDYEKTRSEDVDYKWHDKQRQLGDDVYAASQKHQRMREYVAAGLNMTDASLLAAEKIEQLHSAIAETERNERQAALEALIAKDPRQAYDKLVGDFVNEYLGNLNREISAKRGELRIYGLAMEGHLRNEPDDTHSDGGKKATQWRHDHSGLSSRINESEVEIKRLENVRVAVAKGASNDAVEWAKSRIEERYPDLAGKTRDLPKDALAEMNQADPDRHEQRREDDGAASGQNNDGGRNR